MDQGNNLDQDTLSEYMQRRGQLTMISQKSAGVFLQLGQLLKASQLDLNLCKMQHG
jgi:hypothetical protein